MNKMKTKLANKNGFSKERYVELVREGAKQEYSNPADEIAILRKEMAFLRRQIEASTGKKLPDTEFTAYNGNIENIKAKAKAETNL